MKETEFKLGKWNFKVGNWKVQVNDTKFEHPLSVACILSLILLLTITVAQVVLTILTVLSVLLYCVIGAVFVFSMSHYALRLFGRRGFFDEIEEEVANPETNEKSKTKRYELDFEKAAGKRKTSEAEVKNKI